MAAKIKKISKVYLYGEIDVWGENSAVNFIHRYQDACNGADEIELHIHCVGGNCFEANLISNTIAQSRIPCDIYVDGIAASMASIVMLYGRKIYMADNAFVMIHSPWTFIMGTADDLEKGAKLLRSLAENFISAYSKKTKKTPEEVTEWLKGDNWFSAKEALAEGLIDGIVEAVSVPDIVPEEELRNSSVSAIYKQYKATLNNKQKQEKSMDKANLIKRFNLENVTTESSDAEIEAAIEAKMKAKDDTVASFKKGQITDVVNDAINAKKITEKQRETYQSIGETSGIDNLKAVLGDIKIQTPISSLLGSNGQQKNEDRQDWGFDTWQEKDPRGLEKLEREDNAAFMALYNAKFQK